LCRAHLLALEKLNGNNELALNLGMGRGYSVREVIDTVKKVSGKNFKIAETARRPGDVPVLTADSTKAEKLLGWKRKFESIEKIVETAWQWHNKFPEGYPE
jgi:UDP-glucose 4-epimerase